MSFFEFGVRFKKSELGSELGVYLRATVTLKILPLDILLSIEVKYVQGNVFACL